MSSSHSFDNAIRVEAGTGMYYLGCRIGVERTSSMDCLGKILEPAGRRPGEGCYSGEYGCPFNALLSIGPRKRHGKTLSLA